MSHFFPLAEANHHFPFSSVSDADFKIRACKLIGSLHINGPISELRDKVPTSVPSSVNVDITA